MPPKAITSSVEKVVDTGVVIISGVMFFLVAATACDAKTFDHVVTETLSHKTEENSSLLLTISLTNISKGDTVVLI
jgi:hypothetical protein